MTGELFIDLALTALSYWWLILIATTVGIMIGAIPGFGAQNTLIMLLPLTLAMEVDMALTFMVALYVASHMGSGIPAILLNIPGTGGAAATTIDGYPLAQKGFAQQALVLTFVASTIGGSLTALIAMMGTSYLAQLAFYLHSVEMVVVMLFGLTLIALIAAKDTLKGLLSGALGLLLGAVGADHIYSNPRGTFGFLELYEGIPLIPALVGLFAISEALVMLDQKSIVTQDGRERMLDSGWKKSFEGIRWGLRRKWHVMWTSVIGLVIGAIPGAGASIGSFVAYQQSRTFSPTPEEYGQGHIEGVLAPEAANNGVASGSLVPLLVIGVPGGSTAAVMLVVLTYHGVTLGPRVFEQQPALAYGVFMTMVFAYLMMVFTILPLTKYLSRVAMVPTSILAPIIISFTLIGAFVYRGYMFDMGVAVVIGVLGYIMRKTGFHVVAMLIGIILGPLLEQNFLRALRISGNDLGVFFSSPVANALWLGLALSIAAPFVLSRLRRSGKS